jgi:two-component system sensor histidine kinase/response regulator
MTQVKKILSVDDSADNLFLIETILESDEYHLNSARSGGEALLKLEQSPPDLVLLDIMMPGIDGYEVTRRIRQSKNLPYIPILLLTAHEYMSLVEGLDAGADDFIRKPFDVEELQARVRSLLRMKQAMDSQAYMVRQRDDFVARLTHDLRTPLVAANRMLTFCKNGSLGTISAEVKEAISETINNNEQLLSMVNILLEVYRHDAGHKSLTMTALNLFDISKAVFNELKPLADEKQLIFEIGDGVGNPIDDSAPFEMQGDIIELRRAITNLIGNALKFTDKGQVLVQLSTVSQPPVKSLKSFQDPGDSSWLMLQVIDTGTGISEEDQAEIFDWFRQGKQRRSGSGLGLHLCCRIAKIHGGFINVESTLREGSTFTLFLPT